MRKIIVGAQVSIDGVMQAPGGPSENPTKGFKFGGWSMPDFDEEAGEEMNRRGVLALLRPKLSAWRHREVLQRDQEVRVVSRSGEVDTSWQGSVLLRDIDDLRRLREEDGPNLVTQGSTELVHALLRATSSTR